MKLEFRDFHFTVRRPVDEVVDHRGHSAKMLGQRRWIVRLVRENEAAIALHALDPLHVVERIVEVKAGRVALRMRNGRERAVSAKHPSVVRTGEQPRVATIDHAQSCAAMRATIVQHVYASILMSRHQYLVLAEMRTHEIAGFRHLAFVGDVNPEPPENALLLKRKHARIGVSATMYVVVAHETLYVVAI